LGQRLVGLGRSGVSGVHAEITRSQEARLEQPSVVQMDRSRGLQGRTFFKLHALDWPMPRSRRRRMTYPTMGVRSSAEWCAEADGGGIEELRASQGVVPDELVCVPVNWLSAREIALTTSPGGLPVSAEKCWSDGELPTASSPKLPPARCRARVE